MAIFEQLLQNHHAVVSAFEPTGYLLLCVLSLLALRYLMRLLVWLSVLVLRTDSRARLLHPDNFPQGSVWRERAEGLLETLEPQYSSSGTAADFGRITGPDEAALGRVPLLPAGPGTTQLELRQKLATGDVADVYQAQDGDQSYLVKIARRQGDVGLLAKERMLLEDLRDREDGLRQYVPRPVRHRACGWPNATVFEWQGGLVAADETWRTVGPFAGRTLVWIFDRLLDLLGRVHRAGWVHGAVWPPHLLLDEAHHDLRLTGWVHAERIGTRLRGVPGRFQAWYPAECHQRRAVTPATDLYLAAKSLAMLAGAVPPFDVVPRDVPDPLRRFLTACLLESPRMRPQDACQLQGEITHLYAAPIRDDFGLRRA